MRVFVAGATGAIGGALVPQLVERGHEVTAPTRSARKAEALRAAGATPVGVSDALDAEAMRDAVVSAEPDAVVHQLTALPQALKSFRRFDDAFAATNRLRTEGTDVLLRAARAAGAGTFVAQSFAGWPYAREGGPVKTEEDPLDPAPPAALAKTLAAIRQLERTTLDAGGIALRYGAFYGPGTGIAPGAAQVELIRRRKFPVVGNGAGVWSFIHIDDAAAATVAAVERGGTGIYNIVDDDPAPVSEWLPALAEAAGAKPPRRIPAWLARLLAGDAAVVMLNEVRGASNAKAKRELGLELRYPTWRDGFVSVLGAPGAQPARSRQAQGGAACPG
jgi:nucleoside-diphosphate-sugar epimerase